MMCREQKERRINWLLNWPCNGIERSNVAALISPYIEIFNPAHRHRRRLIKRPSARRRRRRVIQVQNYTQTERANWYSGRDAITH